MFVIMQKFVVIGQTVAEIRRFFDFSNRWPSAMLNLLCARLGHPRQIFGGIYHFVEFGWTRCSSFDNMQVLIFNVFGLKRPIHTQNGAFGGFLPQK